jgi:hypothetical protein
VRVEFRDDGIVVTTLGEEAAMSTTETLTADDELERWRTQKKNAHQS